MVKSVNKYIYIYLEKTQVRLLYRLKLLLNKILPCVPLNVIKIDQTSRDTHFRGYRESVDAIIEVSNNQKCGYQVYFFYHVCL